MNIYAYQRPVGKIEDIPALRNIFIACYDAKSHKDMAYFGLDLGRHILDITDIAPCGEILEAFEAIQKWIEGKASYHAARNLDIHQYARTEQNPVKVKFYRTMAQIACIPHVKYHALWATDFAITLVNAMYPGDIEAVKKEREIQINLLKNRTAYSHIL